MSEPGFKQIKQMEQNFHGKGQSAPIGSDIDEKMYGLYGVTEEERKIIENV